MEVKQIFLSARCAFGKSMKTYRNESNRFWIGANKLDKLDKLEMAEAIRKLA